MVSLPGEGLEKTSKEISKSNIEEKQSVSTWKQRVRGPNQRRFQRVVSVQFSAPSVGCTNVAALIALSYFQGMRVSYLLRVIQGLPPSSDSTIMYVDTAS